MTAGKQTVAGAYAKIESHERECTLRYEALGGAIGDVKGETPRDAGHHRGQPDRVAGQLYGYVQRDIAAARPAVVAQAPQTVGLASVAPVISRP